jgi:hypothetical protein
MDTSYLLSQIEFQGSALDEALYMVDGSRQSPLELARAFLFSHLAQESNLPYRAEEILALLAPSPHNH